MKIPMRINTIIGALKSAKFGLRTGNLHDFNYGTPFCGCALGELFHAGGLNRRQIDAAEQGNAPGYAEMADGLLTRLYGLSEADTDRVFHANDGFCGSYPERRDYMVRWFEVYHQLREAGLAPHMADAKARTAASI